MPTALDVVKYFLACSYGQLFIHRRFQNLCIYAQGASIAYLGEKLFAEDVELQKVGPTIKSVQEKYGRLNYRLLPQPLVDLTIYRPLQRFVLTMVQDTYGKLSSCELCARSYDDFIWKPRGSNRVVEFSEFRVAFENNPVVLSLREADQTR